ncbi:MAG: heme d1 biosynthesis radical SAM protein NirJ [SAR202 cluster bacterium]|jgi:heme d1 biosynthesis radical SAM protein NirJ|nr:heme d1 biosynthesis radical SAM protein NirJ [SAR202 cluster bacterium]|tara:strand:+ start:1321 stop:2532 length:1212 start_codon:yes stop_codon:yes gene_type:complete
MFRLSQFMHAIADPTTAPPLRKPKAPVVIWNLIRRCNLCCKHCYSISADTEFPGELTTEEVLEVMDDLREFGVPSLILSGGEPLLRPDLFEIGKRAKALGFYIGLSTNGTLIRPEHIEPIKEAGFDYLGISIDGLGKTHDTFRQMEGAFDASLRATRLCRDSGINVGLRFTLTQDNAHELPDLLRLANDESVDKFYLSHLNYAGRGNRNRAEDVVHQITRWAMDILFEAAWQDALAGGSKEFVTGNNDADGVYLLFWVRQNAPHLEAFVRERLEHWGGNSSGVNVANIDNLGNVHPDTFWWNYDLGNVKEKPFSEIWQDRSDALMDGLKSNPRPLEGRCAECRYQRICGGNTRVRAYQLTGNPWAEDPACYLSDEQIGVQLQADRLEVTPYRRERIPVGDRLC